MKRHPLLLLNVCLFLGLQLTAQADWLAGSARIMITPENPLVMSGYASRTTPYTSIEQDIWAKALVLEDENGKRVAIITTDLVGINSEITPAIYTGITEKTGIPRKDVLLTWSHTHSGPRLTLEEEPHAGTTEEYRSNSVAYTQALQNQLASLVDQAARNLQTVELNWGNGFVPFVMNRRGRTPRGVRLSPNPSGHVDRSLPCLKVSASDGKLMAALFQVACHNTTLSQNNYALCGDFSGFAQSEVEKEYPNANAMFMTGCAGNANPYPRGTMEIARQHGQTVATEVLRLLESDLNPVNGAITTTLTHAPLTLQPPKPIAELEDLLENGPGWHRGVASTTMEVLKSGGKLPTHYDAPVSLWQFGEDLTLIGLSGEVVSGYVTGIQKSIGHQKLWISAYCHDAYGYLPTAQILKDGGYETRGLFNGMGWFDEEAETDLLNTVTQLAKEAGRTFE